MNNTHSLSFPSLSCCALWVWSSSECWNLIGMYSQSEMSLQPWCSLVVTSTTNFFSPVYIFGFYSCFFIIFILHVFLPKLLSTFVSSVLVQPDPVYLNSPGRRNPLRTLPLKAGFWCFLQHLNLLMLWLIDFGLQHFNHWHDVHIVTFKGCRAGVS